MSKKVAKVVKLEIIGGQAKPGSALASAGINMPKFCTEFNAKTQDRAGKVVPVIITAFEDKSFEFVIKTTPAAVLIKKALKNMNKYFGIFLVIMMATAKNAGALSVDMDEPRLITADRIEYDVKTQ